MPDMEKVIKKLESLRDVCNAKSAMAIGEGRIAWAGYAESASDAIALIEAQKQMYFALEHDWNMLRAEWTYQQEPEKAIYDARTNWYRCGACNRTITSAMHCKGELIPAYKVKFCAECGKPVLWEGR